MLPFVFLISECAEASGGLSELTEVSFLLLVSLLEIKGLIYLDFGRTSEIIDMFWGILIVSRRLEMLSLDREIAESLRFSFTTISLFLRSYSEVGLFDGCTIRHIWMTEVKSSEY